MTGKLDFVGVGGLAYDLLLQVDELPLGDEKYPARLIGKVPGGFIANATCAAAQLDLRTGYVGWVGDDPEGEMLHADFVEREVDTGGLVAVSGETTPFTVVVTDRKGRRAIMLPSFPLYEANPDVDQLAFAGRARVIYTYPRDTVWCTQLRRVASDNRALLALDIETAIPLAGEELRDVIRLADVVFVTDALLKRLRVRSIAQLAEGKQWVIMTAGNKGAFGCTGGMRRPVRQRAHKVRVVDSTGAGDVFHAALIAAKLDGADLKEALAFASAAAAIAVQHRGARGGLPTRDQIERLLV